MRAVATFATSLGDAALLLPTAAALLLYLANTRAWRAAAAWIAALALCTVLTVVAKMIFHACGAQFPALAIRSPSGHTSLSTTFYICGALMLSADQAGGRRCSALLVGAALAAVIAASRVALHAHSVEEVAAGFTIGLICVAVFAINYFPRGRAALGWRLPLALVIGLALLTHGHHLSVEGLLDKLSDRLQLAQHICPLGAEMASRTAVIGALPQP